MKKYFFLVVGMLCIILIIYSQRTDDNGFLESTGLDYEKPINGAKNEDGLNVYHYCYYDVLSDEYITSPEFKLRKEYIDLGKTAIVVIDPWNDMLFPELNEMVEENVNNYILPVVNLAIANDMPIYIFTNNPETINYDTQVCESLERLTDNRNVTLLYYDQMGGGIEFCEILDKNNIDNLIYMGYAVQMCLLYRNVGIISMWQKFDYNIYIIPEATAAVLSNKENLNVSMRNNICTMLSQGGIADIIQFKDFINYLDKS